MRRNESIFCLGIKHAGEHERVKLLLICHRALQRDESFFFPSLLKINW